MAIKSDIDMIHGPILSKIWTFAIPLMFSAIIQLLFNACDIAVVGHFGSVNSLAAVGSSTTIVNFITNFFINMTIGSNVLASRCIGEDNLKLLRKVVHTTVGFSFVAGFIGMILGFLIIEHLLNWMGTPKEVLPLSLLYVRIYLIGAIPTAVYNFGASLLYASGETKKPLYFLIIAGFTNVILNLIFVIYLKMDVAGVATATIIAQTLSAFLVLRCLRKRRDSLRLFWQHIMLNKAVIKRLLYLGVPAGIQSSIFTLSNLVIQGAVNSFGPVYMAGSAASQNIENFVWTTMNTIQPTATTFIAQNIGAKKFSRINKISLRALFSVFTIGAVLGSTVLLLDKSLFHIFTNDDEIIRAGLIRFHIICSTYFVCGLMDVMTGCLRGLGSSLVPAIVSLLGACGLRLVWIGTIFQIPKYRSFETLFASYPISWVITLSVHIICFYFLRKKFPKVDENNNKID
ncbi:MAG: MATE family efflux transporter [Alphaproteobacteria bacterium]|nr:MATE family efflux transporter [Alphaproteobacteria bacterium]